MAGRLREKLDRMIFRRALARWSENAQEASTTSPDRLRALRGLARQTRREVDRVIFEAEYRLGLPMIYVRKAPKGHGRNAQIEGHMPEGARVLVIEDLTTAGGSMFKFIDAIRAAGGIVDHGIALFYYGIFPEAEERFTNGNVTLHHIATWRNVLAVARERKLFDDKTLSEVEAFLDAPLAWSGRNGGVASLG